MSISEKLNPEGMYTVALGRCGDDRREGRDARLQASYNIMLGIL